jgi:MtN3 and saliva related transmembrane protein
MGDNSMEMISKHKFLSYYEKYMMCMGVLGQLLFYVQGVKIFVSKSANDVSIVGFALGLISVSSWLLYGILIKNRVLIIANAFAVVGALFVIVGILIHGR